MSKEKKTSEEQWNTWSEEEGFADLMARMERGERAKAPGMELLKTQERKKEDAHTGRRSGTIRWKLVAVLAAAITLTLVMSFSTFGEKIYTPEAVTEYREGEVVIKINNEERIERDVKEEEIYREIEERLGIYALRLGYKPKGMELFWIEILEDMGEAKIQFLYEGQMLTIYMCKDYTRTGIGMVFEGNEKSIETVDNWSLNQQLEISGIEEANPKKNYLSELKRDDLTYIVTGTIDYKEFKKNN